MKTIFILFGATGDLAKSKILPQLNNLQVAGKLPEDFELVSVGRRELNPVDYFGKLKFAYRYVQVDFESVDGFDPLFEYLNQDRSAFMIYYFSLGPDVMQTAIERFCDSENCKILKYDNAIVATEKPFGMDHSTAEALNRSLLGIATEDQIYRIDHYLYKDTALRLMDYRNQHSWRGDFWKSVKEIHIVGSESNTVGSRAHYYDQHGGAINDFLQNHLLQLLALAIGDITNSADNSQRAKLISSLYLQDDGLIVGQYAGYLDEAEVPVDSHTETFVKVELQSNLDFLVGKRIVMISGKALASKEVFIELVMQDGKTTRLNIDPSSANDPLGENTRDAYYNLLSALLNKQKNNFVSTAEVLAQWEITEQIIAAKDRQQLKVYRQGSSYQELISE